MGNPNFNLPSDLVMRVMQHLNPIDILAIRAACRIFYTIATSRSVWIAALNRVCDQHGIFKPTYPIEKMSLAELEHAASGPHRFVKFVKDFDEDSPTDNQPCLTRRFPCRRKRDPEVRSTGGMHNAERVFLVPGGRFLLTAGGGSGNIEGSVCLWDLGYYMGSALNPLPVASMPILGSPVALTASPSRDGQKLLVALITRTSPAAANSRIVLLQIHPSSSKAQWRIQSELDVEIGRSGIATVHICGSTVVIKSGYTVHVWNWVENTGCRWEDAELDIASRVMVADQTVIAIDDCQDFRICDIPPLLPLLNIQGALPLVHNPAKSIIRRPSEESRFGICSTTVWQRHTQPHLCFMADETYSSENSLSLYSVRYVGRSDSSFLPTYIPMTVGESEHVSGRHPERVTNIVSPLFRCDDRLVMCCRTIDDELVAVVLPIPLEATSDLLSPEPCSALLVDKPVGPGLRSYNIGFCPMSGRVVHPISTTSLQIHGFLLPLEERSAE